MTGIKRNSPVKAGFESIEMVDRASRWSSIIFLLLCLILVFSTVVFGGVDQASWAVLSLTAMAVVLVWIADAWYGRALLIDRNQLLLPILGLIVIGLLQMLPLFPAALPEGLIAEPMRASISLDPYSTRLFVVRLAVYFVFFASALAFINTESRLRKIVSLVVVFGSLMAFFGILQRLANPEAIYGLRGTPQAIPFGPFVNQHHFAAFMEMTAGVTFGFLFGSGLLRDKRLLLAIAAILMGIATVMTSSRGGLLSFVGTLAFVLIGSFLTRPAQGNVARGSADPQRKIALVAGGAAMLILIVGIALFLGENNSVIRGLGLASHDDFTSGRAHFWPIALKIFFAHPLFGAGLDAFGVAFTRYDTLPGIFRVEQAHNDYLQILADAGLAGFACVAAFIYFLFRKGLATIGSTRDPYRRSAAIGALGGCFGILIHSFFDFPLRTPSNAFFFLILAVIAVVSVKIRRTDGLSNRDH